MKAKQVKRFPGYFITNTGKVFSHKTGRAIELKQTTRKADNLNYVTLSNNGNTSKLCVEELVIKHFL